MPQTNRSTSWATQLSLLVLLLASGCSRSEPTAQETQLGGANAALEAARVADTAARTKAIAECSAKFMLWPRYGYIYEWCPSDTRPPFIDEWRPARPSEVEAYHAAGGVPVRDWEGRTASADDRLTEKTTDPLSYTMLMSAGPRLTPILWAIFQSADKTSSYNRCSRSRELLVKDREKLPVEAGATFYCLPTTRDVGK